MKRVLFLLLVVSLCNGTALADVNTGDCSAPFVQRDFPAGITPIFYSSSSAVLYRVCSMGSSLQLVIGNSNATQTTLDLAAQACLDVSTTQLSVKLAAPITDKSVFYCKIG
jgi:hypothetical protein